MDNTIKINGARIHNLKNVDVEIPKGKLTVITGVSGSGKSSLAFDTLYEEGKRRYLMFSDTAFMVDSVPTFESITGLSPTVAVEQRITRQSNPRSTVGTKTKIGAMLAMLFANYGNRDPEYDDGLPLDMAMFQKNSAKGMCVRCLGSGTTATVNEELLFVNPERLLRDILPEVTRGGTGRRFREFCEFHHFSFEQRYCDLRIDEQTLLIYGDGGKTPFNGVIPWLLRSGKIEEISGRQNHLYKKAGLITSKPCPKCKGTGLGEAASHTTMGGKTISELESMYIRDLRKFFTENDLPGKRLTEEILLKLECMDDVGLHHLALSRPIPTLSGGEIQRLFLASYIIAEMDSIIFVFDEPTIGLHEVEKQKLISIIQNLINRGNTVIAVEHDENFMKAADYIIDLGPRAGEHGGRRIFQGTYADFMGCDNSLTSPYLSGGAAMPIKANYKPVDGKKLLALKHCDIHNLHDVSAEIPLGLLVGVAGVSGSGKSSLISDTLVPKLKETLKNKLVSDETDYETAEESTEDEFLPDTEIGGTEHIKKCVIIDQKPIGRSRTSCPATYTGIFDKVRALFAKESGMDAGLFTVNSKGGCRVCKGDGVIHYHVGMGNFIDLECETCAGTGFIEEAMSVTLDGKNIREILEMSVTAAIDFFKEKDKSILKMLQTLERVGMGYIGLGQKTPTISGGEAQRIKLAAELGKSGNAKGNVYILDEPTTGLSFSDSERLIHLMQKLVDSGNTVIVTEHDPAVLSNCDYIIEMGPGGGSDGGYVLATGTPAELKTNDKSIIGRYLK
ncbi:MAG: excinuclease ABC subunit UvrA [Eubacteriales bacterium]|nr:excinuclease ABC subunit UvrA [Eubacteriales bacterium]